MNGLLVDPLYLAGLFALVAFAYSAVGLAGGSSYTALLALFGMPHTQIPGIALSLNTLVSSIASINFIRYRRLRLKLIGPFLLTSIPAAYLGASLQLEQELFFWLLLASLVPVAIRIYWLDSPSLLLHLSPATSLLVSLLAGALLGLVSGMLGIGGGIYLVPLILVLGLGDAKEAAACGSVFIWINSISGLIARAIHHEIPWAELFPLAVAVALGGALGSWLGAGPLNPRLMNRWLGLITLVAIAFLVRRLMF